jgi:hypothetical protein
MAIRRRYNFLGQQRVDTNHLKSLESAVSNDFDELLRGLVTGENKSYVVRGFELNMSGAVGSSANGLQLLVSNSCFLHGNSEQSGTFYTIPTGSPSEILSSTTNPKVDGAFTPNTDNYVAIEFVRKVDDSTIDQVYFWNPTTNIEITRTVPTGIMLGYKIVITTSNFQPTTLPIAIVQTDSSNNVVSVTDRRPMLFRLAESGFTAPNPFYTYPWVDGKQENFYTSTSSTVSPFKGGDKQIPDMKSFFDALMSEFKILKGTPYWYSESSGGSIYRARQDALSTAFTGKGTISHAIAYFSGQVAGMTSQVVIKATSENVTLVADSVKTIDQLIAEWNVANNDQPVTLVEGDGSQVPTANIVMTSVPGRINWNSDLFFNFIGGRLRYKIVPNEFFAHTTLLNNQVAYINLVRGQNIIPNLVFTSGGTVVTSVGNVTWTTDLGTGDFIKDASRGDEYYYEILTVDSPSQVTLTEAFQEPSSGPSGFDAQYAFGVYETNAAPFTNRHIFVSDRKEVPFNEDTFWLFYRQDDGGTVPKVYIRMLGGQELEQGEERQISDNTSLAVLNYIGSTSEQDSDPNYTMATGSAKTNIHLIDGENLTRGIKRLEHRDDVIPRVRVIDLVSTVLPSGASVTIDGETLNNNDYVMFTRGAIEGLYKVSGVGVAVAFEKMPMFKGVGTPVNGDLIRVEAGTSYLQTVWKRVAGYWKPLEVKDATKEPTGFPNRTDSEISFDDNTRTFSVAPLFPSTHFDIFIKGRVFRFESAQEITVTDDEGIFFIYFDENGALSYSTVFDISIITTKVFVSTIYWDVDNQAAILVGDERHGITMDGATHEYLHNTNGAVVTGGGNIGFTPYVEFGSTAQFDGQVAGMTTDVIIDADIEGAAGNVTLVADSIKDINTLISDWNTANPGNTLTLFSGDGSQVPTADITLTGGIDASGLQDEEAQISLTNIVLRDEDIRMNITHSASPSLPFEQILDTAAEIPIFYRDGAAGNWRKQSATLFPVKAGGTSIQWNNPQGPWTQEDITDGYHVSMWIFATNNINEPVIAILGQKQHELLSDAQEQDTYDSLVFGSMPTQEFKVLYRLIFKGSSAFTNTPKTVLTDVRDLRASQDTQFAQVAPNDHGLLSGLNDPDHGPTAVTTSGVIKDGGLSSSDIDVKQSLDTLNKLFGQLRLKEHLSNKKRVLVTGSDRILNNGTKLVQEIRNLVIKFEGAVIDFETGDVLAADGVTPLGINFIPATIPASHYQNYSITLIPSTVNLDNTIAAQLIVLPAAGTNAVKNDAPKAPFARGTKIGQVTVRENSGGIEDITEADISQLGTGGGGSGGEGDANELLERLKNRFNNYGTFEYLSAVIFSSSEEEFVDDASTANYSVVNSNFEFENIGDSLLSVNLLDEEFLDEETELDEVEFVGYWNLDEIDTAATYEVSRDGGANWQPISVSRIGRSDTVRGILKLAEEPANSYSQTFGGAIASTTDLTDLNELSRDFILASTTTVKKITAEVTKTGSPLGYIYAVAVKDDGFGAPSTDPQDILSKSKFVSVAGLSAGVQNVDFEIRFTAPAETYHVIFKTDDIYKVEYSNSVGANKVAISDDGSAVVYTLEGLELDLRIRITSGTDEVTLEGFGVFYKNETKVSMVDGSILRHVARFVGDVDNLDTFTLSFMPDARLLHVYEIGTGQCYRYGAFVLDGNKVVFEANTFNKPESIELEFLQILGGSFDNSDVNGALLAANHLGSTDPQLDKSVAGRGVFLRRPDGTLRELIINDDDQIEIWSI